MSDYGYEMRMAALDARIRRHQVNQLMPDIVMMSVLSTILVVVGVIFMVPVIGVWTLLAGPVLALILATLMSALVGWMMGDF